MKNHVKNVEIRIEIFKVLIKINMYTASQENFIITGVKKIINIGYHTAR